MPKIQCAAMSSVACPALLSYIFPHDLINDTIFGGGIVQRKMCVMILSTPLPETFLVLKRNERGVVINIYRSFRKVPIFLSDFNLLAPELFFLILPHPVYKM